MRKKCFKFEHNEIQFVAQPKQTENTRQINLVLLFCLVNGTKPGLLPLLNKKDVMFCLGEWHTLIQPISARLKHYPLDWYLLVYVLYVSIIFFLLSFFCSKILKVLLDWFIS